MANCSPGPSTSSPKVWASLITNTSYLPGLLTLSHSLSQVGSKYPLIALYTDNFPASGLSALKARGIPYRHVPHLLPTIHRDYQNDPRFYECWSKLTLFSLTEFERVVLLDSDMLVRRNMDELMSLDIDSGDSKGKGKRVFAAAHACVCNPLKREHYPEDWIPSNCAYTSQHFFPERAHTEAVPSDFNLGLCNSGLLVASPSLEIYNEILSTINTPSLVSGYNFPDQDLLSDLFRGRWVSLPYIYNALKTLRWKGVHDLIWMDDEVKNVHFILMPKPWNESPEIEMNGEGEGEGGEAEETKKRDETHRWWWDVQRDRLKLEASKGIEDGF